MTDANPDYLPRETQAPRFTHDCDRCIYLGDYCDPRFGDCDLYYCDQGGACVTVIARFGNDGPNYISGMAFKDQSPAIAEAMMRAVKKNLLQEDNDGTRPQTGH